MTTDELKQNAAAMLACAEGKQVQFFYKLGTSQAWIDCPAPAWDLRDYIYRPKPEPKTRQWSKPSDVPGPVCWLRIIGNQYQQMVIGVSFNGFVMLPDDKRVRWSDMPAYEYSTDRKTWVKCEVTEE